MPEVTYCEESKNPYINNADAKETLVAPTRVCKDGRFYQKHFYDVSIPGMTRFINIIKALALTIFTLFIALCFSSVRSLWSDAFSGANNAIVYTTMKKTALEQFEKHPDWENVKIDRSIRIGAATSEFQLNGAENFPHSTWAHIEGKTKVNGKPWIENNERSGKALDWWNNPEVCIASLRTLGLTEYRFSVEWSAIEPEKGKIDREALQRYVDFCQALTDAGIKPLVTLHHFSEPQWFLDAKGFEDESNIPGFVNFTKEVYTALSPFVTDWITFNEPTIYAFQGYERGEFPPGVTDKSKAIEVLKNIMIAHSAVYDALKGLGGDSRIGIAHQGLRFRPYHPGNPLESSVCHDLTQITHQIFMDFIKTGEMKHEETDETSIYSKPDIQSKLDFLGIQYYTVPLLSTVFTAEIMKSTCYEGEKMTDMPFRFYPEGLATLLEECRDINKPIWITETGSATTEEDQVEFIKKALKVASYAKADGVPVERFYVWSLVDNIEWNMGKGKKFGLIEYNYETGDYRVRPAGGYIASRAVKVQQPGGVL